MRRLFIWFAIGVTVLVWSRTALAQTTKQDQAVYRETVLLDREKQEEESRDKWLAAKQGVPYKPEEKKSIARLTMDFSGIDRPHDPAEFARSWHFPPKRQWWTGCCWCFSATSFYESEVKRLYGKEIKLSELYTIYWEYVEKAREFMRTRGASIVEEGSQSNAVALRWKQHGIVRESDYTGLVNGDACFNHEPLLEEIHSYLNLVRSKNYWDEDKVLAYVRLILDKHLGRPPDKIKVDGREMTPPQFLKDVVRLNLDDYVEFMSFLYAPFWIKDEYKVPDNYWHSKEYCNVPLDEWYTALKGAVATGYSVCIGGDVSEPGYEGSEDIAIIPTFDIPSEFIDQSAREMRFFNHTSEDDHGIHLVGFLRKGDHDWYLVKDSSRSAQRGVPGYYFYRDDYIRLKMLTFMVHKDAVKPLLEKFAAMAGKK